MALSDYDRKAQRRARMQKFLRWWFLINTVFLLLGGALLLYLTQTDSGRQWFGEQLENAASDAIPGSMTVGRIERIGLMPLSADVRDLRFLDPNGMTVLHARDASLVIDPIALLAGGLHVERAQVRGGQLLIAIQADGRTSLEAALAEKAVTPEEKKAPPSGMEMRFDRIDVREYVVELKLSKEEQIRIRVAKAIVDITTPPAVVNMKNISGRIMEPSVVGSKAEITNADGWVHGDVPHVLELTLQTKLDNGRLDGRLSYFNRDKKPVIARLHAYDGLQAEIAALGLWAKTWGEEAVELHFDEKVTEQARRD